MKLKTPKILAGDSLTVVHRGQLMYTAAASNQDDTGTTWRYDAHTVLPLLFSQEGITWIRGHRGPTHDITRALRDCSDSCRKSSSPEPQEPEIGAAVTAIHGDQVLHGHIVALDSPNIYVAFGAFADTTIGEPIVFSRSQRDSHWMLGTRDKWYQILDAQRRLRTSS